MAISTKKLIDALKAQDPEGERIIYFRVISDEYSGYVATGDVDDIYIVSKNGYQTSEGDKDVLLLEIKLDAEI